MHTCTSKYLFITSLKITFKHILSLVIFLMYFNKHFLQYFCLYKRLVHNSFLQYSHLNSWWLNETNKICSGLGFKFGVRSKLFCVPLFASFFVSILSWFGRNGRI